MGVNFGQSERYMPRYSVLLALFYRASHSSSWVKVNGKVSGTAVVPLVFFTIMPGANSFSFQWINNSSVHGHLLAYEITSIYLG